MPAPAANARSLPPRTMQRTASSRSSSPSRSTSSSINSSESAFSASGRLRRTTATGSSRSTRTSGIGGILTVPRETNQGVRRRRFGSNLHAVDQVANISNGGGRTVKRVLPILAGLLAAGLAAGVFAMTSGASPTWSFVGTNTVVSSPVEGGGYPVPPGSTKPLPGTCDRQHLNSNHSESWLAVKPGTEDLVGDSKFFIGPWSTFYDFHLGSYTILGGSPVSNNQVQGYECTTLGGTQDMPPSWTNNTDPNVDFDTGALGTKPVRAYMTTLPFNAFWEGGLHPNGEIDVSYS